MDYATIVAKVTIPLASYRSTYIIHTDLILFSVNIITKLLSSCSVFIGSIDGSPVDVSPSPPPPPPIFPSGYKTIIDGR